MELEVINKLFLELSQVATAQTRKEIELETRITVLELEKQALEAQIKAYEAMNAAVDKVLGNTTGK